MCWAVPFLSLAQAAVAPPVVWATPVPLPYIQNHMPLLPLQTSQSPDIFPFSFLCTARACAVTQGPVLGKGPRLG